MKRIFQYSFVVTILWLGFVTAISFIETPTRFAVEEVPRENILAIGNRVFHALNTSEILFAGFTLVGLVTGNWTRNCRWVGVAAISILVIQTWMLFAVLDERTLAQVRGESVAPAHWHSLYIGLELLKLVLLVTLTVMQIRQFKTNQKIYTPLST